MHNYTAARVNNHIKRSRIAKNPIITVMLWGISVSYFLWAVVEVIFLLSKGKCLLHMNVLNRPLFIHPDTKRIHAAFVS